MECEWKETLPVEVMDAEQAMGAMNEVARRLEELAHVLREQGVIIVTHGALADAFAMEDEARAMGVILGGAHHGHRVLVKSAKYNCGAYDKTLECSCGARRWSDMHGCWQYGHQRPAGFQEGTTPGPLPGVIWTQEPPAFAEDRWAWEVLYPIAVTMVLTK